MLGELLDHMEGAQEVATGVTQEFPEYKAMAEAVDSATEMAAMARERLPDVEIGIIDALPTKGRDYRDPYGQLAAALGEDGLELGFLHLDCPYQHPQQGVWITWEGVLGRCGEG